MVNGVSSNMIENFANYKENFHDRKKGEDLTVEDEEACTKLFKKIYKVTVPEEDDDSSGGGDGDGDGEGDSSGANNNDEDEDEDETTTNDPTTNDPTTNDTTPNVTTNDLGFKDVEDDAPVYEGFTNNDFNASNLVQGRNLHNLLKALLISLVLCALSHKDVSKTVVDPLVRLVHNKLSHSSMVCVLVFVVAYLVIAFL